MRARSFPRCRHAWTKLERAAFPSSTSSTNTKPTIPDPLQLCRPAHNIRGTAGDEVWPPLAPQPGDHLVTKPTYSAFTRSTLEAVLDELHVGDTLVLTGCLTEIGVLATATRALELGYAVEVPPDSQAGTSEEAEKMALGLLRLMPPYGAARKARLDKLEAPA